MARFHVTLNGVAHADDEQHLTTLLGNLGTLQAPHVETQGPTTMFSAVYERQGGPRNAANHGVDTLLSLDARLAHGVESFSVGVEKLGAGYTG